LTSIGRKKGMGVHRESSSTEPSPESMKSPNSHVPSSGVRAKGTGVASTRLPALPQAATVHVRKKPLIVFADDSAIATMTMLTLLKDAGYEVITTSNGTAALRAVLQYIPDLVLLDVEMPELGGIETCERIKQDARLGKVPVVLMTAHNDPRHLRDGFRAGCDGYITKGTEASEVLRKLALKLEHGISIQSR
jgi:CheY-like chemotaxis protein